jgi:hypothetical protein
MFETAFWEPELCANFSSGPCVLPRRDGVMKAYFTNLPMRTWLWLVLAIVAVAYPVVHIVLPAVVHAVVPEAVRTVLSVI